MLCSVHSLLSHLEGAILLIGGLVDKNTYSTYRRAFQPAARKAIFCGPRSQMLPCICWIFEIMKPEQPILWSFGSIDPLLFLLWVTLILVKILQKIYKMPLILLHAARLMIRLTGVWPAVYLSWKPWSSILFLRYTLPLINNSQLFSPQKHYFLPNM